MALTRSRMTEKGQITIPAAIRGQLELNPKDEVEFEMVEGAVVVRPVRRSILDFCGFVPARNPPLTDEELRDAAEQAIADEVMESMRRESASS